MRIREMSRYLNQVALDESFLSTSNPYIGNLVAYKKTLDILYNIPILQVEITLIMESNLYSTAQDSLLISDDRTRNALWNQANNIIRKALLLVDIADSLVPTLTDTSISILLPNTHDLQSLTKSLKSIEKVISLLVSNKHINSEIKIENWEHGSFWINLTVGSAAAVMIISSAVWSSAVISKKITEDKYLEQQVRLMQLKGDSIEDLVNTQKILLDKMIKNETQAIIDKHLDATTDVEEFNRIEESIKLLSELIGNGTQVVPALAVPEEVQNLFPDFSNLTQIVSKIPQIENKIEK